MSFRKLFVSFRIYQVYTKPAGKGDGENAKKQAKNLHGNSDRLYLL